MVVGQTPIQTIAIAIAIAIRYRYRNQFMIAWQYPPSGLGFFFGLVGGAHPTMGLMRKPWRSHPQGLPPTIFLKPF
jgi:hypothetical protein